MPEGPSIVILKEEASIFTGKRVLEVSGNSKIGIERLKNKKVTSFKSWGKHFLICFQDFTLRIHLMLFGSYRINEEKNAVPRISLKFKNGVLNFYTCSAKFIEEDLNKVYDWEADTMSDKWNPQKAIAKLNMLKNVPVCDILLDQNIFAGSGNIIKNEVLFRMRMHPESLIQAIPTSKKEELVNEVPRYCNDFYNWKRKYELRKNYQVYMRKICPRCQIRLTYKQLGKNKRRTFFCTNCQELFLQKKSKK